MTALPRPRSRAALVLAHHRDERVLDVDARRAQPRERDAARAASARAHDAVGIGAAARARRAARGRSARPRRPRAARAAASAASRGVARPRARRRAGRARSTISRGRADVEQLAAEDERQPVAALGLVHVVRGHEHRRALGREAVDLVPELAAAHRVDAGGRLVEEQQRRLVDGRRRRAPPAASSRPTACRRAGRGGRARPALRRAPRSTRARRAARGTP